MAESPDARKLSSAPAAPAPAPAHGPGCAFAGRVRRTGGRTIAE